MVAFVLGAWPVPEPKVCPMGLTLFSSTFSSALLFLSRARMFHPEGIARMQGSRRWFLFLFFLSRKKQKYSP